MATEASSELAGMAGSERDQLVRPGYRDNLSSPLSYLPLSEISERTPVRIDSAGGGPRMLAASRTFAPLMSSYALPAAAPDSLSRVLQHANAQIQRTLSDQVTPLRLASHLAVLIIAAAVLILSQIQIPEWEISLEPTPLPASGFSGEQAMAGNAEGKAGLFDTSSLRRNIVLTFVDKKVQQEAPRQDIAYYKVKAGDTVLAIAARYGLQPETLMWSNSVIEQNPDRLSIGDELRILPVDGVLHVVKPGETLSSLTEKYDVEMQSIVAYAGNGLESASTELSVGKELVIPGGTRPFVTATAGESGARWVDAPSNAPKGSGNFSWPSAGYVSQGYWGGHPAVDIVGWAGSPVTAADGGYVVLAGGGWNGGYGNHVIIDHGNGFTTLYAHLNSIFVSPGMTVSKGAQLGLMGTTGNSTGPHLHFEVRYGGVPYNPANYLK